MKPPAVSMSKRSAAISGRGFRVAFTYSRAMNANGDSSLIVANPSHRQSITFLSLCTQGFIRSEVDERIGTDSECESR